MKTFDVTYTETKQYVARVEAIDEDDAIERIENEDIPAELQAHGGIEFDEIVEVK